MTSERSEFEQLLGPSLEAVQLWVEGHNYKGYEPFDGLSSFLRPLTLGNLLAERLLQQLVRQSPINLRPLLGIKPQDSTKGRGYMAWGYLIRYQTTGNEDLLAKAEACLDWLDHHKAPKYKHHTGAENLPAYMSATVAQRAKIIAKTDRTLTLDRPLYEFGTTNLRTSFWWSVPYRSGIQNLSVERATNGGLHNIEIAGGQECWIRNVEGVRPTKWNIRLDGCAATEVRQCYLRETWNGGGDSGYGVGLFNRSGECLVEDNMALHCRHSYITEYGGMGNVFGYNYSQDPINENQMATDYLMGDLSHHGGDPRFNLWEGNVAARLSFDNVLGSSRWNTAFRNRITRSALRITSNLRAIEVQRNGISNNIVGNILCSTGQVADAYFWTNNAYSTICRFGASSDGDTAYVARDKRVEFSTFYHMNYDLIYRTNIVLASQTDLPPSLYLKAKPAFFGTLQWPPFGPDPQSATNLIPAQRRFLELANPVTRSKPPAPTKLNVRTTN